MNEVIKFFIIFFLFGLSISFLGGLIVHFLTRNGGTGQIQLAFFLRFVLDVLAFLGVYFTYPTTESYLGLAFGLVGYKNILVFKAVKESFKEKRKE